MKFVFIGCFFTLAAFALELDSPAQTFEKMREKLGRNEKAMVKSVKDLPERTIEFEAYTVADGDFKLASEILPKFALYPRWLLKDINVKRDADGTAGTYHFQIMELWMEKPKLNEMRGKFIFSFPLYHKEFMRSFVTDFKKEDKNCFLISGKSLPMEDSPIRSAEGVMRICASPYKKDNLWIYMKANTTFKEGFLYGLLFSLIPRPMMAGEIQQRLTTILENYRSEEDRLWKEKQGATEKPSPPKPN